MEAETKKLHDESKKYSEALHGMLKHQLEFSAAIEEIYRPISGQTGETEYSSEAGNIEGIKACEQYRNMVNELQATITPELEMIETRIVAPADEVLRVITAIRKMVTKRDRKQLDLDRHTNSLTKLQEKKGARSEKEEKQLYTLENNVEIATQEYDYYNNILKEELPALFQLEADFIRPLFQSFYYMQLNIYYTLYTRMEEMKIGYFDMTTDTVAGFQHKRGGVVEETESLGITHFRLGHARSKLETTKAMNAKKHEAFQEQHKSSTAAAAATPPPPVYSAAPPQPGVEYCTALYDYVPQAQGDLAIRAGEVIEIVQRTADGNGWWTGRVNGQQGSFPGNYVQLN